MSADECLNLVFLLPRDGDLDRVEPCVRFLQERARASFYGEAKVYRRGDAYGQSSQVDADFPGVIVEYWTAYVPDGGLVGAGGEIFNGVDVILSGYEPMGDVDTVELFTEGRGEPTWCDLESADRGKFLVIRKNDETWGYGGVRIGEPGQVRDAQTAAKELPPSVLGPMVIFIDLDRYAVTKAAEDLARALHEILSCGNVGFLARDLRASVYHQQAKQLQDFWTTVSEYEGGTYESTARAIAIGEIMRRAGSGRYGERWEYQWSKQANREGSLVLEDHTFDEVFNEVRELSLQALNHGVSATLIRHMLSKFKIEDALNVCLDIQTV